MAKRLFIILVVIFGFHAGVFAEVDPDEALEAHNDVRAAVNQGGYPGQPTPNPALPMMMWDQTLADGAKAYAEQCLWAHSDERINVGENLYATNSLTRTITDAAENWASEYQNYIFQTGACMAEPCGHYTQMVWFDSILVGCGEAVCDPLKYPNGTSLFNSAQALNVVCWYAVTGNLTGEFPYNTDGGNPANTPDYDHDTRTLTMPYTLLWNPNNLVIPYALELSLVNGVPIRFKLDSASRVDYDAMNHVPVLDVNSTRLTLPLVDFSINGVTSRHSLVLKYVPGSANPVLFDITNVQ